MRAGQRLVGQDGKEVLLFPLEYMYITQDEGGSVSHAGTYNMDFAGYNASGVITQCPYYAPCTCELVGKSTQGAYNVWQSVDYVHTPLGLTKACFMVVHDDNLPYNIGDVITQGVLLGHTGQSGGAYGDHVHLNVADSNYVGQEQVPPDNNWQLINSRHIYSMMYVNDTTIVRGLGYNWKTYEGGYDPSQIKKRKNFKWILFKNHIRASRGLTNL